MASGDLTPLLAARSISKSYRLGAARVPALHDVTLDVRPGEFVAIRGPSGSGKTTLLNLLGLLDVPDAGEVRVGDLDAAGLSENAKSDLRRDRFGFVFQTFNLIPVLTAEENVAYPLALARALPEDRRKRARDLLAAVGCAEKSAVRPDLLSGGQRQRVAIARALANDPAVVFADEPTANLDSKTADEILDLMRRLNEEHAVAFLFATHDPRVVERAKRVISLTDGRITEDRSR
ncbi:MAG TPA: ABC transporter ATP-binding protein [Thermoanaerobaculia bacterium]